MKVIIAEDMKPLLEAEAAERRAACGSLCGGLRKGLARGG